MAKFINLVGGAGNETGVLLQHSLGSTSTTTVATGDIQVLTTAITPASTDNDVLLIGSVQLTNGTGEPAVSFRRDTTPVGVGATAGSRTSWGAMAGGYYSTNHAKGLGISFVDSPASVSSITYDLFADEYDGTGDTSVNVTPEVDTDSANTLRAIAHLLAIEINGS